MTMECMVCGKESGKGKYCSGSCKQKAYRNKSNAHKVTGNAPSEAVNASDVHTRTTHEVTPEQLLDAVCPQGPAA